MSTQFRITQSLTGGTATVSGGSRTFTGSGVLAVDETIANGASNVQVAFAVTLTLIKAIAIKASRAVTIKTNDSTTPDDTITLAAGQALFWGNDEDTGRLPFTVDVTALYVSNASGAAADLDIQCLVDATP
jgi:hypothetical protein